MQDTTNILFIDTESNPKTKQPLSIQWLFQGEHGIITEFNEETYEFIRSMWDSASAIVGYNILYDLGVLSIAYPQNTYSATKEGGGVSSMWIHRIFGHNYHTRRLGFHHNLIRHFNRVDKNGKSLSKTPSTPIIDLLKLWAILVDNDGGSEGIGLSAVCRREFNVDMKDWSEETALTDEYRIQDVIMLERLFKRFFEKISNIKEVEDYSLETWSRIHSPATFVKLAYEHAYPDLKEWQKKNDREEARAKLVRPLEDAYFGGLTISFYRGVIKDTMWFDLSGAYSKSMQILNTDAYLRYRWRKAPEADIWVRDKPYLVEVKTTAVISSVNNSLKVFNVRKPKRRWYWNFDLLMLELLIPNHKMEVLQVYEPVPMNGCEVSLPGEWDKLKDEEEAKNGKTTLREFYKLLSNTSYGVKAQRKPYRTVHTNMCIAGMVTARCRLALLEMADECMLRGLEWIYSDTDSVCVVGEYYPELIDHINKRIAPFTAECEGYDKTTTILSLKRYMSVGGNGRNKIMLHGKGIYRVSQNDIMNALSGDIKDEALYINQLSANTPRSMTIMLNRMPELKEFIHPYAFERNSKTERTFKEWFMSWYAHIDTKTSFGLGSVYSDDFSNMHILESFRRLFWNFPHYSDAMDFFTQHGSGADLFDPIESIYASDTALEWLYKDINV